MSAARTNEPAVLPAVIIARPIGAGRYQALVGGRVLGASTPAEPARRRAGAACRGRRSGSSARHAPRRERRRQSALDQIKEDNADD